MRFCITLPTLDGVIKHKSFGSDNHAGVHPAVLQALADANDGDEMPYGADSWSTRAAAELRAMFGARGAFFVFNGTGANILGLSLLLRPIDAVICPAASHINVDECGACERVLGVKLLPVDVHDGKLTPEVIAARLTERGDEHRPQPRVVAISQVTEYGTCYTLDELGTRSEFCRANDLFLYMDGARLANAAAHLDCDPAELAAHADLLSFGATKNGAIGAEAVLVMRDGITPDVRFHRKQLLQLGSKMRFMAAQFLGLLSDDLWLHNARHANAMAQRLADALSEVPGVKIRQQVESNAVFASLEPGWIAPLQQDWHFHVWDEREHVVRLMAAFDTTEEDVDELVAAVSAAAGVQQHGG
jgi:threonine aldolase